LGGGGGGRNFSNLSFLAENSLDSPERDEPTVIWEEGGP
jgi:hypothetical protein